VSRRQWKCTEKRGAYAPTRTGSFSLILSKAQIRLQKTESRLQPPWASQVVVIWCYPFAAGQSGWISVRLDFSQSGPEEEEVDCAHITLTMVKQEVRFGMSLKVFLPKDKCADKTRVHQDLVSLPPERRGKCGLEDSCCFKVQQRKEKSREQSGGVQFWVLFVNWHPGTNSSDPWSGLY
jgi:hypothetical protein